MLGLIIFAKIGLAVCEQYLLESYQSLFVTVGKEAVEVRTE